MNFDRCFSWASQLKHLKHIHIQVRNPTNTSTVSRYWLQLVSRLQEAWCYTPEEVPSIMAYTGRLRPKSVPFSGFGYIGTHSTDTRLIYNVYNGQFRLSQRKFHFFPLKLTCLIQTLVNADNAHFSLSRVTVLPYTCIINPALRPLVCYWLIVYDWMQILTVTILQKWRMTF